MMDLHHHYNQPLNNWTCLKKKFQKNQVNGATCLLRSVHLIAKFKKSLRKIFRHTRGRDRVEPVGIR